MRTILMTGGICSGKSMVSKMFSALGAGIVDTDDLAKTILNENSDVQQKIIQHFGTRITLDGKNIDRGLLKKCIFSNILDREFLNACLHPPILSLLQKQIDALNTPYAIAVIPLLIESPYVDAQAIGQRILVIDTPVELQIKRLRLDRHWNDADISGVLTSQASRQERIAIADDIVLNNDESSIHTLSTQVRQLHKHYLEKYCR